MSASTYDVIIVGVGIVGAACADEGARRGMRVLIVDRDIVGNGATAAGMGHIVVMDDSEAQFALTRYSQQLWHEIRPELPADAEYQNCGTIWVATDEEEMAEVHRKQEYYSRRNVPVEVLDSKALEQAEPHLRKGMAGGLLVPEDVVLYPPCAARFLLERAQRAGAEVKVAAVTQIGQGRVSLDNGTELSSRVIINAAGVGSTALTPGLGIKKRKGHLLITDRHPGVIRHQLVELGYLKSAHSTTGDSVAFNVQPRLSGQILVGSSRQYDADHSEVDSSILARMVQRAQEYIPCLAGMPAIRVWTGFRPATADNLPLIGPLPEDKTLFIAAGHEGLGITASLATARLLIDQITGARSAIPVEPYFPSRLASAVTRRIQNSQSIPGGN